ncbi:hypothetical protein Tcan_13705 [Toxocara canis]|uniref:Uncharacterized protein n=1 Tax=Toxocara canis TaxID=6265 RepID=A0A0B2V4L7_TOXCA|nr:hypothetical protein Tcan_13705 [Toxocara canis]
MSRVKFRLHFARFQLMRDTIDSGSVHMSERSKIYSEVIICCQSLDVNFGIAIFEISNGHECVQEIPRDASIGDPIHQMYLKFLGVIICAVVVSSFGDECLIRHRICSVKDRSMLQKICKRNGGIHQPMLKYAGPAKKCGYLEAKRSNYTFINREELQITYKPYNQQQRGTSRQPESVELK